MKYLHVFIVLNLASMTLSFAQMGRPTETQKKEMSTLIDEYTRARETLDTVLLKRILTDDVDQLVSTGEWRTGIRAAVQGMLASSTSNPGKRKLIVDRMKLLSAGSAVIDCRYEIENPDGHIRRMWSSFIVVLAEEHWKISAIRNMLPARP